MPLQGTWQTCFQNLNINTMESIPYLTCVNVYILDRVQLVKFLGCSDMSLFRVALTGWSAVSLDVQTQNINLWYQYFSCFIYLLHMKYYWGVTTFRSDNKTAAKMHVPLYIGTDEKLMLHILEFRVDVHLNETKRHCIIVLASRYRSLQGQAVIFMFTLVIIRTVRENCY